MTGEASIEIWGIEIPSLALQNECVIRAILAISARDLEIKAGREQRLLYGSAAIENNAVATTLLKDTLTGPVTLEMLATTLLLLWNGIIANDGRAELGHCIGAQYILSRLDQNSLSTRVGRELLLLYARLDEVVAHTNWLTENSRFAMSHRTKALALLENTEYALGHEIRSILTERIALLENDCTFLGQIAQPVKPESRTRLIGLVRRLCRWYVRAKSLSDFQPEELQSEHPFGSVRYSTTGATMLILFCRGMYSLYRNLNYSRSFEATPLKVSIAVLARRILAGAIDVAPSKYSSTLLFSNGLIQAVDQTSELVVNPEIRAWQLSMVNKSLVFLESSVWNFQNPVLIQWEVQQQGIKFSRRGRVLACSTCSTKEGRMEDWNAAKSYEENPEPFEFEHGQKFTCLSSHVEPDLRVVITVEHSEAIDDQLHTWVDENMSAYWTNLAKDIDFTQRYAGDLPAGSFEKILAEEGLSEFLSTMYSLD